MKEPVEESRLRVLVVDDEDGVRAFIARALMSAGFVTETAASGDEALLAIAHGRFDLVISDVRMPVMSGPKFVETLRRSESGMKVLYLTGYEDQLFTERGVLWEDEAFLEKPCTIKGLIESVNLLLYGHLEPPTPQHGFFGNLLH